MQFNRGDTFDFAGPVTVMQNGAPVTDLTGWTARSQIRTEAGALLAELDVVFLQYSPPVIRLTSTEPTSAWPGGKTKIDVQFTTPSGAIVSTKAQTFEVLIDVTQEP